MNFMYSVWRMAVRDEGVSLMFSCNMSFGLECILLNAIFYQDSLSARVSWCACLISTMLNAVWILCR
jgi:hypothetical protein